MTERDYQFDYTSNKVAKEKLFDEAARTHKAQMVIAVLSDHLGPTHEFDLLDLSCSTGIMTKSLASHFLSTTGIDIDESALVYARENNADQKIRYINADALATGFDDDSFDVIVCNQMYEHVPDPVKLFSEIHRILSPKGVCYFGATSRLKVIETHYGRIPFLSYLPKPVANKYLQLLGKGDTYYETLYSYWGLKELVSQFDITDYTLKIIEDPEKFSAGDVIQNRVLGKAFITSLAKMAYKILPGYVWLLSRRQ